MGYRDNNVAGAEGRRRCNCDFVFECLLELLEDALEEDNKRRCNRSVAGEEGRRRCHRPVAGEEGIRRCHRPVAGEEGIRRRNCDFVFECLLELLEDALEEDNRRCDFVYECLFDLLEEEEENDHKRCPR